jgi:hypothetical protein
MIPGSKPPRLGIPIRRRILGVVLVLFMYAAAALGFWEKIDFVRTTVGIGAGLPIAPLVPLLGGVCATPYVLLPCIFDRFPRFIVAAVPAEQLRTMARWFLGVEYFQ